MRVLSCNAVCAAATIAGSNPSAALCFAACQNLSTQYGASFCATITPHRLLEPCSREITGQLSAHGNRRHDLPCRLHLTNLCGLRLPVTAIFHPRNPRIANTMETTTTSRLEAYIAERLSSLGLSRPRLGDHEAAPTPGSTARQPQPKSPPWEPSCTHSAMTAIYHEVFKCRNCGRQSPFGWVYRCVVDTDPLILGAHDRGDPVGRRRKP